MPVDHPSHCQLWHGVENAGVKLYGGEVKVVQHDLTETEGKQYPDSLPEQWV